MRQQNSTDNSIGTKCTLEQRVFVQSTYSKKQVKAETFVYKIMKTFFDRVKLPLLKQPLKLSNFS